MRQSRYHEINKQVLQILSQLNYYDCKRLAESYKYRLNKKQLSYLPKRQKAKDIVDYAIAEIHQRILEGRTIKK